MSAYTGPERRRGVDSDAHRVTGWEQAGYLLLAFVLGMGLQTMAERLRWLWAFVTGGA